MPHPAFAQRPWHDDGPAAAAHLVGMLGRAESRLFRELAQHVWTGAGAIVDAGSFLGRSATCFAQGLRNNAAFDGGRRHRIHCFDDFVCHDEFTIELVQDGFGERIAIGDGTRALFDRQVRPHRELLDVHHGDFHHATWRSGPIELLMVDIAKSPSLGNKVVELFFRELIPGTSLVVHQDYHHAWLPHIHVVMEFLADSFELVEPRADSSAVFALTRPIPAEKLRRATAYEFSHPEQCELMDRAIARVAERDRTYVELARLLLRCGRDDAEQLLAHLDAVQQRPDPTAEGWPQEAARIRNRLLQSAANQCLHRDQLDRADAHAEQALQTDDRGTRALLVRAAVAHRQGRTADCERYLDRLIELPFPTLADRLDSAKVLASCGRFTTGERLLVETLLDPASQDPRRSVCNQLAALWEAQRNPQGAEVALERLRTHLPAEPEVEVLAARVALLGGDRDAALAHMRAAMALGLDDARCRELLQPLGMQPRDLSR